MEESGLFLLKLDAYGWHPDNKSVHHIVDEYLTDGELLIIKSTTTLSCGKQRVSVATRALPRVSVEFEKGDGAMHVIEVDAASIDRIKALASARTPDGWTVYAWSISDRDQNRLVYGV